MTSLEPKVDDDWYWSDEKTIEMPVSVREKDADLVNHPPHYITDRGLESIDVIEAFFSDNPHLSHAWKYLSRAGKKGSYAEDLRKAIWWIERAIAFKDGGALV